VDVLTPKEEVKVPGRRVTRVTKLLDKANYLQKGNTINLISQRAMFKMRGMTLKTISDIKRTFQVVTGGI